MTNELKLPWIKTGYELFAKYGPEGLKVELLARNVGKNKSSFYHHFADQEIFMRHLLDYHFEQAKIIGKKEANCQNIDPELLEVLIEHKTDLFFSRQLRINREIDGFRKCFEKVSAEVEGAFMQVWAKDIGLKKQHDLAQEVYDLTLDNFYLQITEDNLNKAWLADYFQKIRAMISGLKKA